MLEQEVMKKVHPAIKLFGKTISLPPDKVVSDVTASDDVLEQKQSSLATSTSQDSKDVSKGELIGSKQKEDPIYPTGEVYADQEKDSLSPKTPIKNEPIESNVSQEKTLNKPDKMLPCPRCNSMETKFCYYNNYNVSQPRHFCKKCQRYWTAGGTMRNVPVGSGRRKSKNASVPNYRHIMVSDALQVVGADKVVNGMHFPSLKQNGFLIFGSDKLLCESLTVSPLNLAERSLNCARNEVCDHSIGSSSVTSNSMEKGNNTDVQESGFRQPSWPCPLNSAQWIQNTPTAFVPSGFPVTFYPATPYWGCALTSSRNVPLVSPLSSSSGYSALSKSPSSSALGKHSRDETVLRPSNSLKEDLPEKKISDRCVLIPKTLRIDDPNEAAKSSIWSTLGIKSQKIDSVSGTSFFKSFQSKGDRNINPNSATKVLQANPAALSRSLNFRESTKCD